MRKSLGFVTATLLVVTPVHARDWADQTTGRQTGAFVGAQLHVPLSGKTKEQPRASLGCCPASSPSRSVKASGPIIRCAA